MLMRKNLLCGRTSSAFRGTFATEPRPSTSKPPQWKPPKDGHSPRLYVKKSGKRTHSHNRALAERNAIAMPPLFVDQLREWQRLLALEWEAEKEAMRIGGVADMWREETGAVRKAVLRDLKPVDFNWHPSEGRRLTIRTDGKIAFVPFRAGTPVVVTLGNASDPIATGTFLDFNVDAIGSSCTIRIRINAEVSNRLTTLFQKPDELKRTNLSLLPHVSASLRSRLTSFMKDLSKYDSSPGMPLIQYAWRARGFPPIHADKRRNYADETLDQSQQRCVDMALNSKRPLVCIQGPPGTGKTKMLAEVLVQLMRDGKKLLVCAPTHAAIDAIRMRLEENGAVPEGAVLGASDFEGLAEICFESEHGARFASIPCADLASQRTAVDREGQRKEAMQKEKRIKMSILKEKRIILATLSTGLVDHIASLGWFPDVVLVDEAGQATEPAVWLVAAKLAPRLVLVGDHKQLPAFVANPQAAKLKVSLLERLSKDFGPIVRGMLTTQYRSNEKIARWSSDRFYESLVTTAPVVQNIQLSDVSRMPVDSDLNAPLLIIDTDAEDKEVARERALFDSFENPAEVRWCVKYVDMALRLDVRPRGIGIITPYYGQRIRLAARLAEKYTWMGRDIMGSSKQYVDTVDGYQGQQRELIVFSLVRNNPRKQLGFLTDEARWNVAVTRARRQFVIIGSGSMMRAAEPLRSLYHYVHGTGRVMTTDEFERQRMAIVKTLTETCTTTDNNTAKRVNRKD